MGWQRYNRSSNVFEVSDDNGASWQVLHIAGAGISLPPNIAYRDVDNNFVTQTIAGNSVISGVNSIFNFLDAGAPSGEQAYRFVNYNNGQGLRFESLTDGFAAVKGAWLFTPTGLFDSNTINTQFITAVQGASVGNNLTVANNINLGNTLNCVGIESSSYIRTAGGLYDHARSFPAGYFNASASPGLSGDAGVTVVGTADTYQYSLIGDTMFLTYGFGSIVVTGSTVGIYVQMPPGYSNRIRGHGFGHLYRTTDGWGMSKAIAESGTSYFAIYRPDYSPFTNTTFHAYGTLILNVSG